MRSVTILSVTYRLAFRTLRGRLTFVAALTTLPAFLFVIYIAANERRAALGRAEGEARYVAELASREHAHQIAGTQRLLERLSSGEGIAQGSLGNLRQLLPSVLSGFPQIANLWIARADATLAFSVVAPPAGIDVRRNEAFIGALRSPDVVTGRYQVGPIVGRPVLLMAKALRDESGAAHHVLIAALELSWLDQIALQAGLPENSKLVIADREGHVLAGAEGLVTGFATLIHEPGKMAFATFGDAKRLAVAVPLQGVRDVWVVAGPSSAAVYALANRVFLRDLTVLVLFALFAVLASLFATDLSVLRDLRQLARATQKFGSGALDARAPVPVPRGEIRDVTLSFNSMADALEQRHTEAVAAQERLRALSRHLHVAREEEAARIARELHDQLGQELTILRLELENFRRRGVPDPRVLSWIGDMGERIDAAMDTVRRLASELRPGVLDRLGLVPGLEWLFRDFERHAGVAVDFVAAGIAADLDADIATALFRIAQEALTNVARHSRAKLVEVHLRQQKGRITLRLHDNGCGFEPSKVRSPSIGLLGMEERARLVGGEVRVESAPGAGTTVVAEIPHHGKGELIEDPAR